MKNVEQRLKAISVLSPRAEAEQLVCYFAGMDRLELFTGVKPLLPRAERRIARALKRRARGVPLAYLTGEAAFYGRLFRTAPGVLIPRPETERLVEETLAVLKTHYRGKNPRVLDLGTGTGCIAVSLTLEGPPCRMTALDASKKALGTARKNLKRFGLDKKIRLVQSRLFGHFGRKKALWDVLVSNPPYIPAGDIRSLPREVRREGALALDGGREGLDVIDAVLKEAPGRLAARGFVLLEIGDGQAEALARRRAEYAAYETFRFAKDLNGVKRILIARKNG